MQIKSFSVILTDFSRVWSQVDTTLHFLYKHQEMNNGGSECVGVFHISYHNTVLQPENSLGFFEYHLRRNIKKPKMRGFFKLFDCFHYAKPSRGGSRTFSAENNRNIKKNGSKRDGMIRFYFR